MSQVALIELSHLTRTSDGKTLLDNVSISAKAGDQIALTGPSGSGKTVLLRTLAILDPADRGTIYWKGAAVIDADVPRFRSRVMYLHQQPAPKEGTVESALQEPFDLHAHRNKSYSREQMIEWLASVGKQTPFLDQQHAELSGGESQIVALLRAMQLKPNVLLLDEPTSALDADTSRKVETLLIDWVQATNDRSFIWVTHDTQQAQRVSNRTLHMADGQLESV